MNQSKRILLSRIVLGCLFFAMPAAAAADPDGDFRSKPLEGATVADVQGESLVVEASGLPGILPTQLDSWGADPTETADFWALSFPTLPQGRLAQKPPFIAWDHLELGGFAGGVKYGSEFKANTDAVGGLTARVPVPGLPGNWGLMGEALIGSISRNLPFFYPHQSGTWMAAELGADYTLTNGEYFVLRGQGGMAYAYWNHVQSLDNNFGGFVGLDFGFYWIKRDHSTTVDITPQIFFTGSSWFATFTLGFRVDF